jgi:hypothetical protein
VGPWSAGLHDVAAGLAEQLQGGARGLALAPRSRVHVLCARPAAHHNARVPVPPAAAAQVARTLSDRVSAFAVVTLEACAYAGSGDVLKAWTHARARARAHIQPQYACSAPVARLWTPTRPQAQP